MNILKILNNIGPTVSAYNEYVLKGYNSKNYTIITFFNTKLEVPNKINLINGNNKLMQFLFNIKYALSVKNYDIIHMHSPQVSFIFIFYILFAMKYSLISKCVYTVHSSFDNYRFHHRILLFFIFLCLKNIVFCSQTSFNSFPEVYKIIYRKKGTIIRNSVDVDTINSIKVKNCRKNHVKIIYVGRFIKVKDPWILIKAFLSLKSDLCSLTLVGDGPLLEEIEDFIKNNNVKNIFIKGKVERSEVYTLLKNSDLYISSSHVEGLPIAVLEAICCGCYTILSDIPQHREIFNKNYVGNYFPVSDVDALKQKMDNYIKLDKETRDNLSDEYKSYIINNFNIKLMKEKYDLLYEDIISNKI